MATKKPSTFNSVQAKAKWDALENRAGQSITKVVQGTATVSDIKSISATLGQLSNVAGMIFDEAVDAAEKTALQIQKAGKIEIKEGLTAFESALNSALKVSFDEVVKKIQDVFELDLLEQTEKLKGAMGSNFEHLATLLPPKDLPTVNDLLASNELLVETLEQKQENSWQKRADGLLDSLFHMFSDTLRNIKVNPAATGAVSTYVKGRRHRINPYELRTIADQGQDMVGTSTDTLEDVSTTTSPMAQVSMGKAGEVLPHLPQTTQALQQNIGDWSDLVGKLNAFLERQEKDATEDPTEKETKKADTWWKSFKEWFGTKKKSAAKGTKDFLGKNWLKGLGLGLLSMILAPQLWTTLADKFKEYVTWDNIKGTALQAWDEVTDLADKYLTWDNLKKVAVSTWEWIKTLGTDIYSWIQGAISGKSETVNTLVGAAKNDLRKDSGNPKSQGVGPVNVGYEAGQKTREWLIKTGTSLVNSITGGPRAEAGKTVLAGPNITLNANRTSNLNKQVGNITARQTAIRQGNISVTPSITTQTVGNPTATGAAGGRPAVAGSPPISMNTFGFSSATNDQLLLMNAPGFLSM